MALFCYNTPARVRDTLERAGDGVADADMTGEESRGNAALNIHTFCRIKKKKKNRECQEGKSETWSRRLKERERLT